MSDFVSTSLGRVGYGLPQPYSAEAVYQRRDVVQFQGSAFVVLLDGTTGIEPSDDGTRYRLLAARGEAGESNAQWFSGTAVSGTGAGIVAGVPGSSAGDMYINADTSDAYRATAPDTWDWVLNIASLVRVTASDVPTSADGVSVQAALDTLDAKAAADIPTSTDGVSVQAVLENLEMTKLDIENVANNLATTEAGYALDARQGKELNGKLKSGASKEVQSGYLSVTAEASGATSVPITFPTAFSGAPRVVPIIASGSPVNKFIGVSGSASTGITINVYNTASSAASFTLHWIAIY